MDRWTLHVRIADQDFAGLIEQSYHRVRVLELTVKLCVFEEHLFRSEKGRRDGVVRMLQMFLLLIRGQESPAQKTGRELVASFIVHLQLLDESLELIRGPMNIAQGLDRLIRTLLFV